MAFGPPRPSVDRSLPPEAEHIWQWFSDLDRTRSIGMQANPISYAEIRAYASLKGEIMAPWEVAAIRKVDDVALAGRARRAAKGSKAGNDREPDVLVSKTDGAGVSSLMKSLGAKKTVVSK